MGFTFSWLFVTSKLCKILLDISVCLLFSLSYRQSKATKDSLLSACPPHRCFTIYFAFAGRTCLDFHCCLATSGWSYAYLVLCIGGQPTSFFTCLVAYCLFLLTFLSECIIRFFALLKFAWFFIIIEHLLSIRSLAFCYLARTTHC